MTKSKFELMLEDQSTNFDLLVEKLKQSGSNRDDRYWTLKRDKEENGFAIIRFLPKPAESTYAIVNVNKIWFKGPTGKIFDENSLSTFKENDPVKEYVSLLYNTQDSDDENLARTIKPRIGFHSNILVISDPACPENEGKVFLFKYGMKIKGMIADVMEPRYEDKMDPFDVMTGANFKLRTCKQAGYVNYDKSSWAAPESLFGGDVKKCEEVWSQCHDLDELLDRKHYKSYNELEKLMVDVLCLPISPLPNSTLTGNSNDINQYTGVSANKLQDGDSISTNIVPPPLTDNVTPSNEPPAHWNEEDGAPSSDFDDDEEFFQSLANS